MFMATKQTIATIASMLLLTTSAAAQAVPPVGGGGASAGSPVTPLQPKAPQVPGVKVPEVQVIQEQPKAPPIAAKPVAPKKAVKAAEPAPAPSKPVAAKPAVAKPVASAPVVAAPPDAADLPLTSSQAAAERARNGANSPVNPSTGIVPGNLEKFSSAATRVDPSRIDAQAPRTTNEIFDRVPGVTVVNDDGLARHGGIGMRGSPARRGRKVLVMEDGQSINMSLFIDPSTHYVPPVERIESVEVLRGTVIAHGPNNNHGVVNFKNLSPFGANETEISAAYGSNNAFYRHAHTRQTAGNVGVVVAYTGAEADGAWSTERLKYNDFYGAIGWKGTDQDLTLSAVYFRQRDRYDEQNFADENNTVPGGTERRFFDEIGRCKTCYHPGAIFSSYSADLVRAQLTHNYYVDPTTTVTSRIYGTSHRRDRYQTYDLGGPQGPDVVPGIAPVIAGGDEAFVPEGSMLGRLRTYRNMGGEVRAELANRPFVAGMRQDIQVGARYENHHFNNRNFLGLSGEVLKYGDKSGLTIFDTQTKADAVSLFMQTAVHVNNDLTIVPGARLEHYRINRLTRVKSVEEGEAEDGLPADCLAELGVAECLEFGPLDTTAKTESFTRSHVLPGIAFSYSGLHKTTVYGGYNRGLTMHVLREEGFPPGREVGDNFQIGVRSTALRGFTFDVAAFHHRVDDFQIKGANTDAGGNNTFGTADEVHINGIEAYGRLDSRPFTGGSFNVYGEANYTFLDAVINKGTKILRDDTGAVVGQLDLAGKLVPEVPREFVNLTLGMQHAAGWDASMSWTYRGAMFTDEDNTAYGADPTGADGKVPGVWLLSARANYKIPNTGATLFVSGQNLTDKLYITDREDGVKPGQGRTVLGGMKVKF